MFITYSITQYIYIYIHSIRPYIYIYISVCVKACVVHGFMQISCFLEGSLHAASVSEALSLLERPSR